MKWARALLRAFMIVICFATLLICGNVYEKNSVDTSIASYSTDVAQCLAAVEEFNNNSLHGKGNLHAAVTGPNEVTITGKVRGCMTALHLDGGADVIWKATIIRRERNPRICALTCADGEGNIKFEKGTKIRGALKLDSNVVISGGTIKGNIDCTYGSLTVTGGTIKGDVYCKSGFEINGGTIKGDFISESYNILTGNNISCSYAGLDIDGGTINGNIYCGNSDLKITGGMLKGNITSEEKQGKGKASSGISIGVIGATYSEGWPGNAEILGGTIQGDISYNGDITITGGTITGEITGRSVKYGEDEPQETIPQEPEFPEPEPPEYEPHVYYHTVQRGDTLWDLALYYLGDGNRWVEIQAANGGIDPRRLRVGMELIISQE